MTYEELLESIEKSSYVDELRIKLGVDECMNPNYTFRAVESEIARIAYEAGKAESIERARNAIPDIQHRGYEDGYFCGAQQGYEAAAKDPKAWYVLDRNGERVHIGDNIKSFDNGTTKIAGFAYGKPILMDETDEFLRFSRISHNDFEKVTPDTREKVRDELASNLLLYSDYDSSEKAIEAADYFISRIEAIVRAELEGGE